jgi:hypothetical protein
VQDLLECKYSVSRRMPVLPFPVLRLVWLQLLINLRAMSCLVNNPTCWRNGELTAIRLADCAGLPLRFSEPDEDEKCSMTSQFDLRGTGANTGGVCCSGRRADRAGEVDSSRLACRLLIAPAKPPRPCCRKLKLRRVKRGFPVAAARSCNTDPKFIDCMMYGMIQT